MDDRATTLALPGARAAQETVERALFEIRRVIAGQDQMLERVLVCLLAGGHLLIEGVPGLAKTLTIKTAAAALGGTFQRIQFTPDLVPSDLVGTRVYRPDTATFDTEHGPVFCNFLLADEINRAPAKVQSALLEVMQEHQVTIGRETMRVPEPFLVMATQNPIESEGTYPLPEAQVDRFMLKVVVGYPEPEDELTVVERALDPAVEVRSIVTLDELAALRAQVAASTSTRRSPATPSRSPGRPVRPRRPASPRSAATSSSARARVARSRSSVAARALALIKGRDYVIPQDLADLAQDVLRHRLVLTYEAIATGVREDSIVDAALAAVPAPSSRSWSARHDAHASRDHSHASQAGAGPRAGRPPAGARPPPRAPDGRARRRRPPRRAARTRLGARPDPPVCRRRRRPAHRLERDGTPERAPRAGRRRRASRLLVAAARRLSLDGLRHGQRRKTDVVEGVALASAHITSRRGNRVGALTFGGASSITVPQRQGRRGMIGALVAAREEPETAQVGATSLGAALHRLSAVARQRGVVFVVSDFLGPRDWREPLLRVAARHEVTAIEIRDRREHELPDVGYLWLADPETGRRIQVDTRRAKTRAAFAAAAAADRADVASELASLGVDHLTLTTDEDWLRSLGAHLTRERRRR